MGEVFRADDLRLGQQVALKFLPPDLTRDPDRLARFHNEVRLARQVSHPNVCRVYDIGEVEGETFLSMEYIDGEDMATLLRRIGRLPKDKALEIGRQLCAGLAAAHDRGVLHRDLKPSNIMLDGRGRARITDFGLAGEAGAAEGTGVRAGTPPYMAPEQIAGGEATARSDLYALGLVLYELFTGKRAFQGEKLADLVRAREETTPTPPSTLVEGLDPAVERVILRCLENDPKRRPASALAVAAGLPGGDPLAMALAAGETPLPEMVAAAGETGGLTPAAVRACLGGLLAGILALVWLTDLAGLPRRVPPPKPTEALVDRTQDLIRRLGYPDRPAGTAYSYGWHRSYLEHIQSTDPSPGRWDRLAKPHPAVLYLSYRQSPRRLEPANLAGITTEDDPAPLTPGMISVMLTASGDLWGFEVVPSQVDEGAGSPSPPDWRPIFAEAGLRIEDFAPAAPRWVPPVFGDTRSAWEGTYPDAPEYRVHVEAASYRGRPVFFHVYWPWNRPLRVQPFEASAAEKAANILMLAMGVAALVLGMILARRNLRMGRGDRKGAFRLAACVFAASFGRSLCMATHIPAPAEEWGLLVRLCGWAIFNSLVVWLYYIALEPLVRRRWPERIISWSRLLSGRIDDPMVGRDLLIGVAFGVGLGIAQLLVTLAPAWTGLPPVMPDPRDLDLLLGPLHWIAAVLGAVTDTVTLSLVLLFFLFLTRTLHRRLWAAMVAFFLVAMVTFTLFFWQIGGPFAVIAGCAMGALVTLVLFRSGLVALATALFAHRLLVTFPVGAVLRSGFALPALFALAVLFALVVFAVRAALAGRSLLEVRFLEE
jgi:serine/threonine-protein kinase